MTQTTKLMHNGVEIWVDPAGKFCTKIGGNHLTAATIATLKKKMDAVQPFESFKAYVFGSYNEGAIVREIVGTREATGSRRGTKVWVDGHGVRHDEIVRISPDSTKLVEQLAKMFIRHQAIEDKNTTERDTLREKFTAEAPK